MSTRRYLVGSPRAPGLHPAAARAVESAVAAAPEAGILRQTPAGRRVVSMTPDAARQLAGSRPDLVVEEDHPLERFRMPGLPAIVEAADAGPVLPVRVTDPGGAPIADCTLFGRAGEVGYKARTGPDGTALLPVGPDGVESIIVSPRALFWSRVATPGQVDAQGVLSVTLPPLDAARSSAWVHRLLGTTPRARAGLTGRGVSVAIVDSGIGPHPWLAPRGGYNTLDGQDPGAWNVDDGGHGSHCAGLVAARPAAGAGVLGVAPEAELYAIKVFPGGFVSDLVEAVEWCTANRIDVVSLSLGSSKPSSLLAAALARADAHGVTAIAATGNEGSHVAYPAAFPTVMGVGAVGRLGSFPATSAHSLRLGRYRDWWGGLFEAAFTNFGSEVDVCAPGVAVVSSVPEGYAAWDGTSMACPLVAGLAALVLQAVPWLRTGDASQARAVREILRAGAVGMGLPPHIQGRGLPTVPGIRAALRGLGVAA